MYNQPSISLATAGYPPTTAGIHGGLLEVTVLGCNKLKDMEWISRQDPYASVEYGSSNNRTRVCTDGGKNPTFQEKFMYSLIEGLRGLNIILWNSNTFSDDDFIGSGKVQLGKVLSKGFDDSSWPLLAGLFPSSYPPHSTYPPQPYGFHYAHASPYPTGGYPPPY